MKTVYVSLPVVLLAFACSSPVSESVGRTAGAVSPLLAFSPCPSDGAPCIILPVGDSITAGYVPSTNSFGGGYRIELLSDIWAGGRAGTFVGDNQSGPATIEGRPFPTGNDGYSGYIIDDAGPPISRSGVAPLVPGALTRWNPNIVALMIGTNDMGTNNDVANAPARLGNLIDAITATSPNALLVVAQITPTGDDSLNALVAAYNAAIPALVQSRVASGAHIVVVDMYAAFTANAAYKTALLDGTLHPNGAGYALMGDVWYAAIQPYLAGALIGTHVLVNEESGLALDNAESSNQGAGVLQWGVNGGPQQEWVFTPNDDGSWSIASAYSEMCLDDPAFATANGVALDQWPANGGANQRWSVYQLSDGSFRIWNVYSQGTLDGASATTNGAPVLQWGWNGGAAQRWFLR